MPATSPQSPIRTLGADGVTASVSRVTDQRRLALHDPTPDPAGAGLEPTGDGRMWVHPAHRAILQRAALDDFEAVMASHSGRCLRALVDRENWRLELPDAAGRPRGFYLKKHHVRTWSSRWRAWRGLPPGPTAGRVEAMNVGRIRALGIEVMGLVAYGERLHGDGLLESFVITEELTGFLQLDDFLRVRFPARDLDRGTARDRDFHVLMARVAETARQFHGGGYNHRDLYACHFFVREPARGEFEIRMIDLQRVQKRDRGRTRWIVKDLAQLAWSIPSDRVKCTHKLAFYRQYLGVSRLSVADKRLLRQVLAKELLLQRKLGGCI